MSVEDQVERAYGRRVHYEPRHAPRAGKHRLTCRRDWMPVWVIVCPILGFVVVSAAVVVVMRLA